MPKIHIIGKVPVLYRKYEQHTYDIGETVESNPTFTIIIVWRGGKKKKKKKEGEACIPPRGIPAACMQDVVMEINEYL